MRIFGQPFTLGKLLYWLEDIPGTPRLHVWSICPSFGVVERGVNVVSLLEHVEA